MEHFTPISAAIGGLLIGISATTLWLANGRIAGISGIVGGLWTAQKSDIAWRARLRFRADRRPVLYQLSGGDVPRITISAPFSVVIVAGLLVGFGTRLGSGCTSGHGVCGMARVSRR